MDAFELLDLISFAFPAPLLSYIVALNVFDRSIAYDCFAWEQVCCSSGLLIGLNSTRHPLSLTPNVKGLSPRSELWNSGT